MRWCARGPKTRSAPWSAACAQQGLPITVRGSGTGNYGQCMPLHGGVILDLSAYNQLLWAGRAWRARRPASA